jgi:hypothetical protein
MSRRSKIDQLGAEVRTRIEQDLISANFSGYKAKTQEYTEAGVDVGGVGALHRYGQRLERKIAALKASTEAAQMIVAAVPDSQDARSQAVVGLVQTEVFEVLLALQEASQEDDPGERVKLLSQAARAVADLSRASVHVKRFATEMQAKTVAAVEQQATAAGLSGDVVALLRQAIVGALAT